ncbi:MAG: hypothetical protein H8E82_03595 [Candidatus Marinimicrobia bacterium]|nr:hypothetical protein [Candidatus Neomarinimicrobiota bacterium]
MKQLNKHINQFVASSFRAGSKIAKTSQGVHALYCIFENNAVPVRRRHEGGNGVKTFVHILNPALKDGAIDIHNSVKGRTSPVSSLSGQFPQNVALKQVVFRT